MFHGIIKAMPRIDRQSYKVACFPSLNISNFQRKCSGNSVQKALQISESFNTSTDTEETVGRGQARSEKFYGIRFAESLVTNEEVI